AASGISNLAIDYYPNRTQNYMNAIARESTGTIYNVYFQNRATTNWSYSYYNGGTGPTYVNCIFNANGHSTGDYSGSPTYDNALWDIIPSNGNKTNYRTRAVTTNDLSAATIPADLFHTGN